MYSLAFISDYYQWIPFIVAAQSIFFYLPRVLWNYFRFQLTGYDLDAYFHCQNAKLAYTEKDTDPLAEMIENILTNFNRQSKLRKRKCCLCCRSDWIWKYIFIKFLYLVNGVYQLGCIHYVLGFGKSMINFSLFIKNFIENYEIWDGGVYFPRVAYCLVKFANVLGFKIRHVAECVLTVNIINEKFYMFFWVWTAFVVLVTFLWIFWWIFLMVKEMCTGLLFEISSTVLTPVLMITRLMIS